MSLGDGGSQCADDQLKVSLAADSNHATVLYGPGSLPDEWQWSGWTSAELALAQLGLERVNANPEVGGLQSEATTYTPSPSQTIDNAADPRYFAWRSEYHTDYNSDGHPDTLTYTFPEPVRVLRVRFINGGDDRATDFSYHSVGRIARADIRIEDGRGHESVLQSVRFVDSPDWYALDCDLGTVSRLSLVIRAAYPSDHSMAARTSVDAELPLGPHEAIHYVGLSQIEFWGSYTQKLWMRVKRKAAYLPG